MIALTSPYLWYTTRATGLVALVLFTLVVSLGTLVANRIGGTMVGRFELNELHRSISIVAIVFLVIHILTTIVDSFVSTGLISVFVPMTSTYKRVAVAIGAVGFDLILAVWLSSLLKVRIENRSWRFIHWFSWLAFIAAITHSYLTGTDTRDGAGLVLVIVCAATVLAAALWRYIGRPTRASGRTALSPLAGSDVAPAPAPSTNAFPRDPRTTSARAKK
jgi:sulfoxide reductase heme-binding subunit YedZ